MDGKFYILHSEKNEVDKTLTDEKPFTGLTLKMNTSVVNPTFLISKELYDKNYNYMKVDDGRFNRFYFVGDPVFTAGGMVMLSCHTDVLSTFKTRLRSHDAILQRQEREANLYFNDNEFYTLNKETLNTIKFPNSLDKTGSLVMIVQGGN